MTDTIPEEITHLDFDPKEGEACEGFTWYIENIVVQDKTGCPTPAKVAAVRSCCGVISLFCMDCYNTLCALYSDAFARGMGTWHRANASSTTKHPVKGNAFTQVHFL